MSEQIQHMAKWLASFRDDVNVAKQLAGAADLPKAARRWAVTALNYLVTRMDLIPDWEEGIGVLDDAMVLRICLAHASDEGGDKLDPKTSLVVHRLANESERIDELLGKELAGKLRGYCEKQTTQAVRGRTPDAVLGDGELMKALLADVDHEVAQLGKSKLGEPDVVERTLKSYLTVKLK